MKPATLITLVVLSLITLVHLLRLILGTAVTVAGLVVPVWGSAFGALFFGALTIGLWREHQVPRSSDA